MLSPEARAAQEAECTTAVANAAMNVMRAQDCDRTACARGLAICATVVAGDDAIARVELAREMLRLVKEIEPTLLTTRWQ